MISIVKWILLLLLFILLSSKLSLAQNCNADFTVDKICNTTTFSASDRSTTAQYSWVVDGKVIGTTDVLEYVHAVDSIGTFTFDVSLTMSRESGCSETKRQSVTVHVTALLDASIITPDTMEQDNHLIKPFVYCDSPNDDPEYSLRIINNSTTQADIESYSISWGDGSPAEEFNLLIAERHTYKETGLFDIVSVVKDANGCGDRKVYPFFNGTYPLGNVAYSNQNSCAPEEIEFEIAGTRKNSPSTVYNVWVNNNIPGEPFDTITFPHPPERFFTLPFDTSPCDTIYEGQDLEGQFTIFFQPRNACPSRDPGTDLITLNRKQKADFKTSHSTRCTGEEFTFTNMSTPARYYDEEFGCLDSMRADWKIYFDNQVVLPNSGLYEIIRGGLDSLDGFSAIFKEAGTYNVRLLYESVKRTGCGVDSLVKSICVLSVPESDFRPSQESGCLPLIVNMENISNTLSDCKEAEYTWEIELSESDCSTEGGFSFIRGVNNVLTNKNSIFPTIQFETSGIFNVSLIVENQCGIDTISKEITVSDKPIIELESIGDFCARTKIIPKIEVSSGCNSTEEPTYFWLFPGGTPSAAVGEQPDSITYNQPGTYTVTVSIQGDCETATTSRTFTVNPIPKIPDIRDNSPVCPGSDLIFNLSTNLDLSYEWEGPDDFSSSEKNPVIKSTTLDNEGTYSLTITDDVGCQNDTTTEVQIFDNIPVKITPEDPNICIGDFIELQASGAEIYTWTPDTYLDKTTGPFIIASPTEVTEIEYILTGVVGDCQNKDTIQLTVHPLPEISIEEVPFACLDNTIQLEGSPTDGENGTGRWTGTGVSVSGEFTPTTIGLSTLTYHFQNEEIPMCEDRTETTICVIGKPVAIFLVSDSIGCFPLENIQITNTSPSRNDCIAPTYKWRVEYEGTECFEGEGKWSFASGNETSENPSFNFEESGVFTLIQEVINDCDTDEFSQTITVGIAPTATIDPIENACQSANLELSAFLTNCIDEEVSYLWTFPTINTPSVSQSTVSGIPFPLGRHDIQLTVKNTCGETSTTAEFFVLAAMMAGAELKTNFGCLSDDGVFTLNAADIENTSTGDSLNYLWTVSGPADAAIEGAELLVPTSIRFNEIGIYTVSLTTSNNVCAEDMWSGEIEIIELPIVELNDISDFCNGAELDLTEFVTYSNLDLIDSIHWEFDGSEIPNSNVPFPTGITYDNTGPYEVKITIFNRCGETTSQTSFRILEEMKAQAELATTFICKGETLNVTDQSSGDDLNYTWEVSGSGEVNGTNTATPTFIFSQTGEYEIKLTVSNETCQESIWIDSITVSEPPLVILEDDINDACSGATIDLSSLVNYPNEDLVDSVVWELVGSLTPIINDRRPTTIVYENTGDYTVKVKVFNGCGSDSAAVSFSILEPMMAAATLDTNFVCKGETIGVTNSSIGDQLNYLWQVSGDGEVERGNTKMPTFSFPQVGKYEVKLTVSNDVCSSDTWIDSVEVSDKPLVSLDDIEDACSGTELDLSTIVQYPNEELIDSVSWELVGSQTPQTNEKRPTNISYNNTGDYTVKVKVFNGCGIDSAVTSFSILEPMMAAAKLDTIFTCKGNNIGVTDLSTGDQLNYKWEVSGSARVDGEDTATPTFEFPQVGKYEIKLTVSNAVCAGDTWTDSIEVSDKPLVSLEDIKDACSGAELDLAEIVNYPNEELLDSIRWVLIGSQTPIVREKRPTKVTYDSTGNYTVKVIVFNKCGIDSSSVDFSILEPMMAAATIDTNFICKGETIKITNDSKGDALNYQWEVSEPGNIVAATTENPSFEFSTVGAYEIKLIVSNDVCGMDSWVDSIRVSEPPQVELSQIKDFCSGASFDLSTYVTYPNEELVDSVRWDLFGSRTPTVRALRPVNISYDSTGEYEVKIIVFNGCGIDSAVTTFNILEPLEAIAKLDTTFGCTLYELRVENLSEGGRQRYQWEVSGTANATISDATVAEPTFDFSTVGEYEIKLTVSNEICGMDSWTDSIRISEAPEVELNSIKDFCSGASFDLESYVSYPNEELLDSVRWILEGSRTPLRTDLRPSDISYDSVGIYEVKVLVFNGCGVDSTTTTFNILEPLEAIAKLDTTFGCTPYELTVENLSKGGRQTYEWEVNGSANATISDVTLSEPTFNFPSVGKYEVKLTVSNEICGMDSCTDSIRISETPEVELSQIGDFCSGASFDLESYVSYPNEELLDSVRWILEGSRTPLRTDLRPSDISYDSVGIYEVKVLVFNGCGVDSTTTNFNILEPLESIAKLDTTFGCTPYELRVENLSKGGRQTYQWEVSGTANATISDATVAEPTFDVSTVGEYEIKLTVSNEICGMDSWTDSIRISEAPEVELGLIKDFCSGASFDLESYVSYPNEELLDSVRWILEGSRTPLRTALRPSDISYDSVGIYEVKVLVFNGCGVDSATTTFNILEPLEAIAKLDTTFGCTPYELRVENLSKGGRQNYQWEVSGLPSATISDATISAPTFGFTEVGEYEIKLTVSNEICGMDSWTNTIRISEAPEVELSQIGDFCSGASFDLESYVSYPNEDLLDSVRWVLLGSRTPTLTDFRPNEISYDSIGTYEVKVLVFNGCGVDSATTTFNILEPLEAIAKLDTTFDCTPYELRVENLSKGGRQNYQWEVSGLPSATISNATISAPTFSFTEVGEYEIKLTVSNEICGMDSWTDTIRISEAPEVELSQIEDFCSGASFDLESYVSYPNEDLLDSVRWVLLGSRTPTSTDFRPVNISYDSTGEYEVKVLVFNGCGVDSATTTFNILEPLEAIAKLDTTFGCTPHELRVENLSKGGRQNYQWEVSGLPSATISDATISVPTFSFTEVGEYEIKLTVSNEICGMDSWIDTIRISEAPEVKLSQIEDFCSGASFDLESYVSYPNEELLDSVRWVLLGSRTPTSTDFRPNEISYDSIGKYEVKVLVFNGCGIDSAITTFNILEPLEAIAKLDTTFGCTPHELRVENLSKGGRQNYQWEVSGLPSATISDATISVPTFSFTEVGEYEIKLTVSNEICGMDSWVDTIRISEAPEVELSQIEDFCSGASFDLESYVSYPNEELLDSVQWILNGSRTPVVKDYRPIDIRYDSIGIYEVKVLVFNGCGIDSATTTFNILEPLEAIAKLDTTFGCTPYELRVENLSKGGRQNYQWEVNGLPSATISDAVVSEPIISFSEVGEYEIKLTVFNEICGMDMWVDSITISEAPKVELTQIEDFCSGASFDLENYISYPNEELLDSVRWELIGSNTPTSTELRPINISYENTGQYQVKIIVFNGCGIDSATTTFNILEPLEAIAELDTIFGCTPHQLIVKNLSKGGRQNYQWEVSGLSSATISDANIAEPVFSFTEVGKYEIKLKVFNEICGMDSWMDSITISQAPKVELTQIEDFCNGASLDLSNYVSYPNESLLDSVRWVFNGSTTPSSNLPRPIGIEYDSIASFPIVVAAYNGCGVDSATVIFDVLEPLEASAVLDTTFGCKPFTLVITENLTKGGKPNFEWSVNGPNTDFSISDTNGFTPNIEFRDTGVFVIQLRAFNEVCGEFFWRESILINQAPTVVLQPIEDVCESLLYTPVVEFSDTTRIDSVRWIFDGGSLATSTSYFPSDILFEGAGDYNVSVTVANGCEVVSASQAFTIDTIAVLQLGPTDTICKSDGFFQLPSPTPIGGTWSGATIADMQNGIIDPTLFEGSGVDSVLYTFIDGTCVSSKEKAVFIIDLSGVDAGADRASCISDEDFLLIEGVPQGGWYEGAGIIDSIGVFSPSSLSDGKYTITYKYRFPGSNCIGSDSLQIEVNDLPVPSIENIEEICKDMAHTFDNATSNGSTYEWLINDGGMYQIETPAHIFRDTGVFEIQLIATSDKGCVDSIQTEVYVADVPVSSFEMDNSEGCAVLPVNFFNESIGYREANYRWVFGNGEISQEQFPETVNYDQGISDTLYIVTLTVNNHCGSDTDLDSVLVFPSPLADFDATIYTGCTPLEVAFNNLTLGEPETFQWNFGNGEASTDSIPPDQIFIARDTTNRIYTVTLTAFNECGRDEISKEITVKPSDLRAFFSVEENEGCEPFTVDFINTTSPDTALVLNWDFGDSNGSDEPQPTHTYYAKNDTITFYNVTLEADNGCSNDDISLELRVLPAPKVSFELPEFVCKKTPAQFINTSPDVSGVLWNFGDDSTSVLSNPLHAFNEDGRFNVNLTVYGANTGCPNSDSAFINVRPLPIPTFSLDERRGCPPVKVSINNQTENAQFYQWNFGDGNTAVGFDPENHTYRSSGLYDITLIATDIHNCIDSFTFSSIEVYDVPVAGFNPIFSSECELPQFVYFENTSTGAEGFQWTVNNSLQKEREVSVTYEQATRDSVVLIAQNKFLCADTIVQTLGVFGTPIADFGLVEEVACKPYQAIFENYSQNGDAFTWIFHDQEERIEITPSRLYPDTGSYKVTLIASNDSGCADTLIQSNFVQVYPSPTAGMSIEEIENRFPNNFQFTDQSSNDVVAYWWNFGDGNTSLEENPIHRYVSSFDKTITHVVENEFLCKDSIKASIDLDAVTALYIPNILEPSSREHVEMQVFCPKGIGLVEYHITVYARNGQLVWESTQLSPEEGMPTECWNGTYRGEALPAGVLVWEVKKAVFTDGGIWKGMLDKNNRLRRSGFLNLVR